MPEISTAGIGDVKDTAIRPKETVVEVGKPKKKVTKKVTKKKRKK